MKKRIRTFYKLNDIEINSFTNKSSYDILSRTIFSDKLADKSELKNEIENLTISLLNELWVNGKNSEHIPEILQNLDNKLSYDFDNILESIINMTESEFKADESKNEDKKTTYKVGDIITFGNYNNIPIKWHIIDVEKERVLLVSVDCVTKMPYLKKKNLLTSNSNQLSSWDRSYVKTWLNSEFINMTFSDTETEKILFKEDAPEYFTTIFPEYNDRVFILSVEEVKKYMNDYMLKLDYWWWLRGERGYFVPVVNEKGRINEMGYNTDNPNGGVRPAMYIKNII